MRLLLFSDLHLDAPGVGLSTVELRTAFGRLCELARDLRVEAVCSAGNLYDQNDQAPDTADVLWNGFASISPIPVFLVPGSSDWLSPGSLYRKPWSNNVHVFTEPHLTALTIANGITLWGAAHVSPTHPVGFLGTGDLRGAGLNLALFHGCEYADFTDQHVDGPMTAPFHAHQIRQSGLDHALVGHLPNPVAAPDYTYPGRPTPRRSDGLAAGGAVLVTVHSDGSVDQEWYELFDSSPFAKAPDAPAPVENRSDDLRPTSPPPQVAAPVWVTALDGAEPDGVFGKPGAHGSPAPTTTSTTVDSAELLYEPDFPESTVRGQFVRSIRRGELSREDQNRVLRIGLAAIDGQSDFGEL